MLQEGEKKHGRDSELASLVERTVAVVVPRLLRDGHLRSPGGGDVVPVVVHGDLCRYLGRNPFLFQIFSGTSPKIMLHFSWNILH